MPASPSLVWAHPDARLWVAIGATIDGDAHAGVVERVGDSFVAVDGFGRRLGSFARRDEADDAVRIAWSRGAWQRPAPPAAVRAGLLSAS
jgi:hypothetical protein